MLCTSIGDVMATPLFESLLHAPRRSKRFFRSYIYKPPIHAWSQHGLSNVIQATYAICRSQNGLPELQASYTHFGSQNGLSEIYNPPTSFAKVNTSPPRFAVVNTDSPNFYNPPTRFLEVKTASPNF